VEITHTLRPGGPWAFRARTDGRVIARAEVSASPVADAVPQLEHRVTEAWLPAWDAAGIATLGELLLRAIPLIDPAPKTLDFEVDRESVGDEEAGRRAFAEEAGFDLFQKKAGYVWTDPGGPLATPQLRFEPLASAGRASYGSVMAACIEGTLDRNDLWYWTLCGPEVWASEMFGYLEPGDEASWLLARNADDEPVGHVALGTFDEPATATIVHIGVLPAHRGRGHVDELLAGAAQAARARGFRHIVSTIDTLNEPMAAALVRAGHDPDARPWHSWHYRMTVS
jgi:RimJ/RimL family protein N-acetyltransferase